MQNSNQNIQFSFSQMLIFLVLQVALLGGAFYLGTRFSNSSLSSIPKPNNISDAQLSQLLPNSKQSNDASESAPSKENHYTFQTSNTVVRIKSSSNSEYTLQIASFPEEESAIQVLNEWKEKGYMAFISVEDIADKGKWFRVNVGNFGDEDSAQEFAKVVEQKEGVNPQVVLTEQ